MRNQFATKAKIALQNATKNTTKPFSL